MWQCIQKALVLFIFPLTPNRRYNLCVNQAEAVNVARKISVNFESHY